MFTHSLSAKLFFPIFAQTCNLSGSNVLSSDVVQGTLVTAERNFSTIRESWDLQWVFMFGPPLVSTAAGNTLYFWLSLIGRTLAIGTLLFFMLQWFRDINDGNFSRPISELLFPLLVAFLLGNGSIINLINPFSNAQNPLAGIIQELRSEYQVWEDRLYQTPGVVGPESVSTLFPKANAIVNTQGTIQDFFRPCSRGDNPNSIQTDPNQPCDCFQTAIQSSINLIDSYQNHYFNGNSVAWWNQRQSELINVQELIQLGEVNDVGPLLAPGGQLEWTQGGNERGSNDGFLVALQIGFRQTLETALLFTAMLGPLAIGASLLPVPIAQKGFVTWFTGLAAVGSAKFFYFILVGLTAQVLLQIPTPPVDLSWFGVFMNTVAPLLSMGLASGGGAALFGGLNNFVNLSRL